MDHHITAVDEGSDHPGVPDVADDEPGVADQ
jgi:hypothetical protein